MDRWLRFGIVAVIASLATACGEESGSDGGGIMTPIAGTNGTAGTAPVAGTDGTAGTAPVAGTNGAAGAAGTAPVAGTGGTAGTDGTAGTTPQAGSGGMAGTPEAGAGGMAGQAGSAGGDAGSGGDSDVQACLDLSDDPSNACTQCGCNNCLDEALACDDEACQAIVDCGRANGCTGAGCYCGTDDAGNINYILCLGAPAGPCKDVIAENSGLVADGTCANNDACASALDAVRNPDDPMYDPTNPMTRASNLSLCTQGQRMSEHPLRGTIPEIEGACMDTCGS